jgi:hypothetical protein
MRQMMRFLLSVTLSLTGIVCYCRGAYAVESTKARTGILLEKPVAYEPAWSDKPAPMIDSQRQVYERGMNAFNLPGPPLPQTGIPEDGAQGAETTACMETTVLEEISPKDTSGVHPLERAPASFVLEHNTTLGSILPPGSASHVLEPSVAIDGKFIFYTANWFAARSKDSGSTWSYVNAYGGFEDFCCDQDTVYDPARRAIIWYRMGIPGTTTGENVVKIGVSTNGGASFCTHTIAPTNIDPAWTGQWFDYPHLALSNDYLWIATNMFDKDQSWTRTIMMKMDLDSLAACQAPSISVFSSTNRFNFTPVQGATTAMYWATHNTTSSMRIYMWSEDSTTVGWVNRAIPAWTATIRGSAVCTTQDSHNPCARLDDRIVSGWIANWDTLPGEKTLGFFWNVKQGGPFPNPYTNAAVFKERDRAYVGRPYIRSGDGAWIYAYGAPNARGNLGVSVTHVSDYPHHYVGIDDDFNGAPPRWRLKRTATGAAGPIDDKWGDYLRVRPLSPAGLLWGATGYTLDSTGLTVPRYVVFGRERDERAYLRWLNK